MVGGGGMGKSDNKRERFFLEDVAIRFALLVVFDVELPGEA